jgi:hypothetical protein
MARDPILTGILKVIKGATGRAILRALAEGQLDPKKLAPLRAPLA